LSLLTAHRDLIERTGRQPQPVAIVVQQTDLCHRFPYLETSGCARAMVTRGWASDLSLQTRSFSMHTSHPLIPNSGIALFAVASLILSACSGMTQQEKSTAIGAGVGAIGGSILTGGSTAGTLGGAAVGGVIGHEVNKPAK
jgi:osmotically inducible lipoprotein OsmB